MVADWLKSVPTLDVAGRPLRSYRDLLLGVEVERQLSSLDAYIVALLLDFLPDPLAVTDLTGAPSEVASLALCHDRVARVVTWLGEDPTTPSSVASARALESVAPSHALWEIAPDLGSALRRLGSAPGELAHQHLVVIAEEPDEKTRRLGEMALRILDTNSRTVVLVVGLGRVGECRTLASLARCFPPDSDATITLARELRGMAQGCSLGLVYQRSNEGATTTLHRIEALFVTNYDYLDLLTEVCELRDRYHLEHNDVDRLRAQLERERTRPLIKAIPLQAGRRMVQFARRYRQWLAPEHSFRDRLGKSLMTFQRTMQEAAETAVAGETSEF